MPVHNHGSEEGAGLACNESRLPDGSLLGACMSTELPVRRLRKGFAEKLEARHIKTVFKHIGNRMEKIWEQVDGVWVPTHECDYYDDKETGENVD